MELEAFSPPADCSNILRQGNKLYVIWAILKYAISLTVHLQFRTPHLSVYFYLFPFKQTHCWAPCPCNQTLSDQMGSVHFFKEFANPVVNHLQSRGNRPLPAPTSIFRLIAFRKSSCLCHSCTLTPLKKVGFVFFFFLYEQWNKSIRTGMFEANISVFSSCFGQRLPTCCSSRV